MAVVNNFVASSGEFPINDFRHKNDESKTEKENKTARSTILDKAISTVKYISDSNNLNYINNSDRDRLLNAFQSYGLAKVAHSYQKSGRGADELGFQKQENGLFKDEDVATTERVKPISHRSV